MPTVVTNAPPLTARDAAASSLARLLGEAEPVAGDDVVRERAADALEHGGRHEGKGNRAGDHADEGHHRNARRRGRRGT